MRERESVATCTARIRARKASRSNISPLENIKVDARIPPGHDLQHVTVGVEVKTVRQPGIPVEMRFWGPLPPGSRDGAPFRQLGRCPLGLLANRVAGVCGHSTFDPHGSFSDRAFSQGPSGLVKPRDVSVSTRVRDRRTGSGWPMALHKVCGLEPLKDTLHTACTTRERSHRHLPRGPYVLQGDRGRVVHESPYRTRTRTEENGEVNVR